MPLVANAVAPVASIGDEQRGVLFGGTLVVVAAYQLFPYKNQCLKHCRTPLGS